MQCLGHNLREKGVDSIRRGVLKLVVAAVPETRRYFIAISEAVTANCVCSERYLGFRMLPWVQNATLGLERYLGFRMLPWVHYESSEEVCPCDVVHGILFRGDGSSNNLSIHVIRQHLEKTKHCSGKTNIRRLALALMWLHSY